MGGEFEINCLDLGFRELNKRIRDAVRRGFRRIRLLNVNGQRYICGGLKADIEVEIQGSPGNDLGVFMDGPIIDVHGNAGDCVGNTMNDGLIVIHGFVGDVAGYSMRGGRLYIEGDAGYRLGIHMKEYGERRPVVVIGGHAMDFMGEYMAGGVMIVLGLTDGEAVKGRFIAAGMHGGRIFLRGGLSEDRLGFGAMMSDLHEEDYRILRSVLEDYCRYVGYSRKSLLSENFIKIMPRSRRPYKLLYHQTKIGI